MKIYKISSCDRFAVITPNYIGAMKKLSNPWELLDAVEQNKSLKDLWVEHEGIVEKKKKPLADICKASTGQLVFSELTVKKIDKELSVYGEFLPMTYKERRYWLMNIQNSIPADGGNSISDRSDKDWFDKITFKEKDIQNQLLWTTPLDHNTQIFCSQRFIDLIEESGFKGLKFEESLAAT
ncbi:MAG: hypothetical protein ACR2PX_03790 [Endozoicomonas sp.]|uniref:hypothetical protein n=1 Tax=Endozoicomonas sp. TaxID=1892382 RepID=UPI003D9B0095